MRIAAPFLLLSLATPLALVRGQAKPDASLTKLGQTANAAFQSSDWATAAASYRKIVKLAPQNGSAWHRLGYALHAQGQLDSALKAHVQAASLSGQFAATGAYNAACVHALQGRKDEAFAWLDKAIGLGFAQPGQLQSDTDMDPLRDDPRFAEVMTKIKKGASVPFVRGFAGTTQRSSSRLSFWAQQGGCQGEVRVEHGLPAWQDKYATAIESPGAIGRAWRFGQNFWTTFDTNVALKFGDTEIAPGGYYLVASYAGKQKGFLLHLLDPAKVRAQRIDAFEMAKLSLKGAKTISLQHAQLEAPAKNLSIQVEQQNAGQPVRGQAAATLRIQFGPHELTAPFAIHLAKK